MEPAKVGSGSGTLIPVPGRAIMPDQRVKVRVPETKPISEAVKLEDLVLLPTEFRVASTYLGKNEAQDLAEVIRDMGNAAVGYESPQGFAPNEPARQHQWGYTFGATGHCPADFVINAVREIGMATGGKRTRIKKASSLRVFISHATEDLALVKAICRLLKEGAGLKESQLFCSWIKGHIPNGELFVNTILKKLKDADVVLCLLSRSYLESVFCIAEAGAGQLREKMKKRSFFSLVVPPITFSGIGEGVLHGVQSGRINDSGDLDHLPRSRCRPKKHHCTMERGEGSFSGRDK